MESLSINSAVRRLGPKTDRAYGRIGKVVEVHEGDGVIPTRYRVLWTAETNGHPIRGGKGIRTWVKFDAIEKA